MFFPYCYIIRYRLQIFKRNLSLSFTAFLTLKMWLPDWRDTVSNKCSSDILFSSAVFFSISQIYLLGLVHLTNSVSLILRKHEKICLAPPAPARWPRGNIRNFDSYSLVENFSEVQRRLWMSLKWIINYYKFTLFATVRNRSNTSEMIF